MKEAVDFQKWTIDGFTFRIVTARKIYRSIPEVASIDFNIVSLIRECLNNMSYNSNPLVCWHVRGKLSQYDGITVFEFLFSASFTSFNVCKKGLTFWIKKLTRDAEWSISLLDQANIKKMSWTLYYYSCCYHSDCVCRPWSMD